MRKDKLGEEQEEKIMPHTKLKVCSVLLILDGAREVIGVLAGLVMLVDSLLEDALGIFFSESSGTLTGVLLLAVLLAAGMAVLDLMAGINGLRFCNGKCDIKFCRIPAIIVIVLQAINIVLGMLDGYFTVASVVHIVVAVICIVFAGKVEQYNLTRPAVEDTLVFNLKDGY